MKSLHSLLIVYIGPPLFAVAALLVIVSWFGDEQSGPGTDVTVSVQKGGRIGSQSEMFR
ncbi:hypothetical protein [Rhizobium sp. WYJ-E13]|uniref:hypothetical protein n=1 Tax=Rhizobium sp. WYJ-E13 TaxID=2849093 RepID=UPI001C1F0A78|nr:hypothetical protein [Rhizobium sp. WYJ-E13]QWW66255.1 hypothetical protein KQ933_11475 [Rhizobium sp. WYJ-E13]